ncbi:MAG: undecaprenyl-diphosphate phosphatase [Saprospiraceae bacterium]|nr:undecaprenyl-diphosphate phosphatase [Saprospiraceae bacterium]
MSEYILTVILGIVQGITEFLPISSDGHLEIAKFFLGDKSIGLDSLSLTIVLHIATTLSICYVLRLRIWIILKGILNKDKATFQLCGLIFISMLPAAIVGVFFEEEVSKLFNGKIELVSTLLIINGIILYIGNLAKPINKEISYIQSLAMGIAQMLAILPGISRSGTTISTASVLGINRSVAAEFSFIMLLPLMFGKIAKDMILDNGFMNLHYSAGALLMGFSSAFIVGIISFRYLLSIVKNVKLDYFAYYCIVLGIILLIYLNFKS